MPDFVVRGVIPPLLTPFTASSERIDYGALRAHVQWLVEKGVHGLMPCGTTGEGPLLSLRERRQVLEAVIEAAARRAPVLVHVGTLVTAESVKLARHARACGAQAISVVAPYFYRLDDEALTEHFCRVADAVDGLPTFLYNIPGNTGNHVTRAAAEAVLARCPNVIGIKDSSGDMETLKSFVGLKEGRFQVVCGSDALLLRALQAGACASVSGHANLIPEVLVNLFQAFWQGDVQAAQQKQTLLNQVRECLQNGGNLSLFKHMLDLRGQRGGRVRSPLREASPEQVAQASHTLQALHVL